MLKQILAISVLLCLFTPGLRSQWRSKLSYSLQADYNTLLFLQTPADQDTSQLVRFELSFTPQGEYRSIFNKTGSFKAYPDQMQTFSFQLPAGSYQVDISIESQQVYYQQVSYTCQNTALPFLASDLILSITPFSQPKEAHILLGELPEVPSQIYFFQEVNSPKDVRLTARAVLYREAPLDLGDQTTTYESLQQRNRLLNLEGGYGQFTGIFQLNDLEEGAYLVEILIFRNDKQLAETSARFIIPWQGRQKLFAHLGESLEMMQYLGLENEIQSLKQLDPAAQKPAFSKLWETLYPGEGEARMESYFKRVFTANELFGESGPGWQSDRGKIYILYGNYEAESFVENGEHYLRWMYRDWDLTFLFKRSNPENTAYLLIQHD